MHPQSTSGSKVLSGQPEAWIQDIVLLLPSGCPAEFSVGFLPFFLPYSLERGAGVRHFEAHGSGRRCQ